MTNILLSILIVLPSNSIFPHCSENKLSNLPADFFTDMPSLRNVYLDRNKFVTFDSDVFSEALSTLDSLYMEGEM